MKELSIEEKAQRYDEAINVAKSKIKNDKGHILYERDIINIFPELKESEDERIRKAISDILLIDSDEIREILDANNILMQDIDAWLEKQVEKKSIDDLTPQEAMDIAVDKCFEKGEQSPADKVEPKFHKGQWIVWQDKCYKVNYNGCGYELIDQNGLSTSLEYGTIDEDAHLWTIQDAKDGDVLAASDGSIFLFAGVVDCACKHYVALTTDGAIKFNEGLEHYWETSTAVHPATKEQRDTLMKAMADAGYTFDFEKKELKKIEQNPADRVKPKFKYGDVIHKIGENTIYPIKIEGITGDNGSYIGNNGKDFITIKFQDEYELIEQKPAEWSEEDEYCRHQLIVFCENCMQQDSEAIRCANWLKSLKDRYTWKPSEEQMKALNYVVNLMASSESPNENDYYYNVFKNLRKQLKKLREE